MSYLPPFQSYESLKKLERSIHLRLLVRPELANTFWFGLIVQVEHPGGKSSEGRRVERHESFFCGLFFSCVNKYGTVRLFL